MAAVGAAGGGGDGNDRDDAVLAPTTALLYALVRALYSRVSLRIRHTESTIHVCTVQSQRTGKKESVVTLNSSLSISSEETTWHRGLLGARVGLNTDTQNTHTYTHTFDLSCSHATVSK